MTPVRTGVLAAIVAALGFFAVAEVLGVTPGKPMATRKDAFFQSDAGGLIEDAIIDYRDRARGVHPAIYPLWTTPLHALAVALSPTVPMDVTATYGSRILVNLGAALGLGVLVAVLRLKGYSVFHLALYLFVMIVAGGNTIAAIPDHFGLSLGALAASLAMYLAPATPRKRLAALLLCAVVVTSITITNILFPLLLMLAIARTELSIPRRVWLVVTVSGLFVAGGMVAVIASWPEMQDRIHSRFGLYVTWTVFRDPGLAATMAGRAVIDSVVSPTPAVDTNNFFTVPMLTYQARGMPYVLWPYDAVQSVAAVAWLGLLIVGTIRAWRTHRSAAVVLLLWFAWNVLFHTVWGDEFFLYTPHYAWALITLAFLGLSGVRPILLAIPVFLIAAVNIGTLRTFRGLLDAMPS